MRDVTYIVKGIVFHQRLLKFDEIPKKLNLFENFGIILNK